MILGCSGVASGSRWSRRSQWCSSRVPCTTCSACRPCPALTSSRWCCRSSCMRSGGSSSSRVPATNCVLAGLGWWHWSRWRSPSRSSTAWRHQSASQASRSTGSWPRWSSSCCSGTGSRCVPSGARNGPWRHWHSCSRRRGARAGQTKAQP